MNAPGWSRRLFRAALITLLVSVVGFALDQHYRLAWDSQQNSCLPYTAYWVDINDQASVRGAYFAFHTIGLEPNFKNGTLFLKQLVALPGDRIDEDGHTISVNGKHQGDINSTTLEKLHKTPTDFIRHLRVPEGQLLFMGTAPNSYDGRYWGLVAFQQILGRAYPLW